MKHKFFQKVNHFWNFNTSHEMFATQNIWRLTARMVIPTLLLTLFYGIYIFIDNYFLIIYTKTDYYQTLVLDKMSAEQINVLKDIKDLNLHDPLYNVSIIRTGISWLAAVIPLLSAFPFLINSGIAVIVSRYLSLKQNARVQDAWKVGFYGTLFLSLLSTIILFVSAEAITKYVSNYQAMPVNLTNDGNNADFIKSLWEYHRATASITITQWYLYFVIAATSVVAMSNYFIYLIRAEGRNLVIILFSFVSNLINIFLDYILIKNFNMGYIGGGLATMISVIILLTFVIGYMFYLNKKKLTLFQWKYLIQAKISWKLFWWAFVLSLIITWRYLTVGIAYVIYIAWFVQNVRILLPKTEIATIFNVNVGPVYNLFFFSVFGIVDGIRPIVAYNYSLKNYRRVKQAFWISILIAVVYGLFVFFLAAFALGKFWFYFLENDQFIGNANFSNVEFWYYFFLRILMAQIVFMGIAMAGIGLFQAANQLTLSYLTSSFHGILSFFPVVGLLRYLAITNHNILYHASSGFANVAFSGILIFIIAVIWLYKFMDNKNNSKIKPFDVLWDQWFSKLKKPSTT